MAGRGIDVFGLSHVFNFDVPLHAEDYVHRIGRTGRAGHRGRTIMLAVPDDARYIAAIEKLIGRKIPRIDSLRAPLADDAPDAAPGEEIGQVTEEASTEKAPRKSSRGGRRRRGKSAAEAKEPPEEKPTPEKRPEAPAETAPEAGDTPPPRPAQRKHRDDRRGEHEARPARKSPVVGLGDHVPAFLLRSYKDREK